MEIWRIAGGKRSGPFPDYEVRGWIEKGEIEPDERVWHEGLEEWTRIDQVGIYRELFEKKAEMATPPPLPKGSPTPEGNPLDDQVKGRVYLMRRFWARWMDLFVYGSLWWLALYFGGRDVGAASLNPWLMLVMYIPWFVLEAWLIHRFGTTPGKWLMGLSVSNDDGSLLSLKQSIWRSLRVLVTGIGFGWRWLSPLCQTMSWFTARRIGKPVWDFLGGHKVTATELNPFKLMALIFGYLAAMMLQFSILGPYVEKMVVEQNPEMAEFYEPWHQFYLPKR
ncbi:MAG: RDD family protein [Luteolibacter sp.]